MLLYKREKLESDWMKSVTLNLAFIFTRVLLLLALVISCPCDMWWTIIGRSNLIQAQKSYISFLLVIEIAWYPNG